MYICLSVNVHLHVGEYSSYTSLANIYDFFVVFIKYFPVGAKLLIGDIRKMIKVKSTMGEFKLSGTIPMTKPNDSITLDDVRFVYKVHVYMYMWCVHKLSIYMYSGISLFQTALGLS